MKWIGQHIYDLISRFRSDVYLEDIDTGTIASGGNLGLDSNNKIVKATISSGSGDMTGVDLTGTLPITIGSETNTTSGDYSSTIGINVGNGINIDGGDLVTNDSEIDHDQLDNFTADEHFTQANITTVGTIGTGTWQGTAVASAYLDADTAHLSTDQTFTGSKTFGGARNIFDGDRNATPGDGAVIHVDSHDVTDTNTSASGTAAMYTHVNIENPRLLASNASVTTTDASTLYIKGAPLASTNQTITNAYAVYVDNGDVFIEDDLYLESTLKFDSASLSAVQTSTESFADNDTSLMTSAAIDDRINAADTTVHATAQTGKSYRIYNMNFRDDIATTKHYLPLKGILEQLALTREEVSELAVTDGRVASITLRVENLNTHSGDAVITFGIETNIAGVSYDNTGGGAGSAWTIIETEALTAAHTDDDHVFHYVFDTAKHWDSTDMWAVSIESDVDMAGTNERFFVTVVVEDDWSTYLAGSSRELTTTP